MTVKLLLAMLVVGRKLISLKIINKMKEEIEERKYNYWRGFLVGGVVVFLIGVVPMVVVLLNFCKLILEVFQ